MTDKQIIKAVKGFVKGMLGKQSTASKCWMVCAPLQTWLSMCGVETELTEGEITFEGNIHHHYWLTMKDGRVIDPTATQFNLPNLYCETKPESYKQLK